MNKSAEAISISKGGLVKEKTSRIQQPRGGKIPIGRVVAAGLWACLAGTASGQNFPTDEIQFGGYLRGYAGWNLDDPQELPGNDRWRTSMRRGQVHLEADGKHAAWQWRLAGRMAREAKTGYLRDLETLERTRSVFGDPNFKITDIYDTGELREGWVQFQPTDNLNVKFGRQQVVWGETDIFQALDVIHGYDFTWAPLLEEPDETRKSLMLLNTTLTFPAVKGSLQLVIRPGWDSPRWIGSTFDLRGGRARTVGFKGASSMTGNGIDYDHPEGEKDKVTYALRWRGLVGGLDYHLSYVKAHYTRNAIVNTVFAPFVKAPNGGALADFIFPIVDVYGAGVNSYAQRIDTVFTTELVFTRGEPFNVGVVPGGTVASSCLGGLSTVPEFTSFSGLCGVKRKNSLMAMVRAEKTFSTMESLGTSGPLSASLQLFNTRILGFRDEEELVQSAGYPARAHRDSTLVTLLVRAPFMGDKLTPTIAFGRDISNKGSFSAFALDYEIGTHWRLRAEADFFHGRSTVTMNQVPGIGLLPVGTAMGLPGFLDRNDRLYVRATYQF